MATIIIQRNSEFINHTSNYQIFIDGRCNGQIAYYQTKDFVVATGRHSIIAKIDWCSSQELSFEIKNNETKTFSVEGFKNWKLVLLLNLGIIILNLLLINALDFNYGLYLILPALSILIYYVTFGRKKYLTLKEIDKD